MKPEELADSLAKLFDTVDTKPLQKAFDSVAKEMQAFLDRFKHQMRGPDGKVKPEFRRFEQRLNALTNEGSNTDSSVSSGRGDDADTRPKRSGQKRSSAPIVDRGGRRNKRKKRKSRAKKRD